MPRGKKKAEEKRSERDLAGLYRIYLADEAVIDGEVVRCPVGKIALPVIVTYSPRQHPPRRFANVTIKRAERTVKDIRCQTPGCGHTWAPELPTRPGNVLKFEAEVEAANRFRNSILCPKCAAKGVESQGRAARAPRDPSGRPVPTYGRPTRQAFYLKHEEVERLRDVIDPGRPWVAMTEKFKDDYGNVEEIQVGWKSKPLTHAVKDKWGRKSYVPLAPFVRVEAVEQTAMDPLTEEQLRAMQALALEIRALDDEIEEARTEFEEARDRQVAVNSTPDPDGTAAREALEEREAAERDLAVLDQRRKALMDQLTPNKSS